MKNCFSKCLLSTALTVMSLGFVPNANAEDEKAWSLDLNTTFVSDYMFRGFNLYDGIGIQPSVQGVYSLGKMGNLNALVWSHLSAEGDRKEENFTEIDYLLSYDFTAGPITVSLGHYWYTYENDNTESFPNTNEVFGSLALDALLAPTLTVYHDYRKFDAQYYELGFSHTIESDSLGEGFNMTPSVNFGFASEADKVYADNGLAQITYGVSFDMNLGDFAVTPSFNYTRSYDDLTVNEFWTAISIGYSL